MSDRETIWAETTDGGLLKQLFGYYPTMHDAKILNVVFDPSSDVVDMTIDYHDLVEPAANPPELSVRIRLRWLQVKNFEISIDANDIGAMRTRREGDLIRTEFESGYGVNGAILSERFEAILERLDPRPDDESERFSIRYRP